MTMTWLQRRDGKHAIPPDSACVLLCVVLVVFLGSAQLLHMHAGTEGSNPTSSDAGCSLCAVAHLAALPAPELASPVVAELVQPLHTTGPDVAPPRFPSYSHESRPPPVLTA